MAKQLKIDDMLEAMLVMLDDPDHLPAGVDREKLALVYNTHVEAAEACANAMAKDLAAMLDLETDNALWEGLAFGGLCAPFWPRRSDQPMPKCLEDLDEGSDWETRAVEATW